MFTNYNMKNYHVKVIELVKRIILYIKLNHSVSVISFLLPKDEAEGNKNDITQVQKFSWRLLASIPVYNA